MKITTTHDNYLVASIKDEIGEQYIYKFDNGYGASVIRNKYSYGGKHDLWEVANIYFDDEYEYSITDLLGREVEGWLDWYEVDTKLRNIKIFKLEGTK